MADRDEGAVIVSPRGGDYNAIDPAAFSDADGRPGWRSAASGPGSIWSGSNRWRGPGHPAILRDGVRDYIVYHAYDARNRGVPTLRIQALGWTADGWPVARP